MLTYFVERGRSEKNSGEKILHIEGDIASGDLEKLNTYFFDALNSSEHLIVNIEKICDFDCSFIILVCSIRKTAQLLNKQLTIRGKSIGNFFCEHEQALHAKNQRCMFATTPNCYLWESIFKAAPKIAEK